MKVIPVVDILNGVVIHAARGQRKEYRPLQSILTTSTQPIEVAASFRSLGFSDLYIADLDAIIDCSTNYDLFKQIASRTDLSLMVDAGVTNIERAQKMLDSGVAKLIVGTETLLNQRFIGEAIRQFGSNRVVVSLDLRGDLVLVKPEFDGPSDPLQLLRAFQVMGVSQVIILDLLRVGSGEGVNVAFVKEFVELGLDIYVGGGVRGIPDLLELRSIGVSGALVATALHTGIISMDNLKQYDLL